MKCSRTFFACSELVLLRCKFRTPRSAFALPLTGNRIDQETLNILNQLHWASSNDSHVYLCNE